MNLYQYHVFRERERETGRKYISFATKNCVTESEVTNGKLQVFD